MRYEGKDIFLAVANGMELFGKAVCDVQGQLAAWNLKGQLPGCGGGMGELFFSPGERCGNFLEHAVPSMLLPFPVLPQYPLALTKLLWEPAKLSLCSLRIPGRHE